MSAGDAGDAGDAASTDRTDRARPAGGLARRFPAAVLAGRALSRNRLRSGLATLGIVIGVFAIASLTILGGVLELTAANSLGGLGGQVVITPAASGGDTIAERDLQAIRRASGTAEVVPLVTGGAVVERGDRRSFAQLYGMDRPGALFVAGEGDLPDRLSRGAVLGPGVAETLGVEVGRTVTIEGVDFRVVAILADNEDVTLLRPDNAVILPRSAFADPSFTQVIVQAESGSQAGAIASDVRATLNARGQRVEVFELSSVVARIDDFFALLSAFLLAIGAISLVVAGVSILNVMLMSVSERRDEIGILRAVGVQRDDVLRMVLAEATLLGVVGGTLGLLLAVVGTFGLALAVDEVTMAVAFSGRTWSALGIAFSFGVSVSLVSGAYPAWKAAAERPIEALRSA